MNNLSKKIVFRPTSCGTYLSEGNLFLDHPRAVSILKLALASNYTFVKFCRDNEITELYKDKHNNFIYREYERKKEN